MATVVTVEHHPPGLASGHHDDLILEQHRHSKRADVKRLRRSKVGNEQDQALKLLDSHEINLAGKGEHCLTRHQHGLSPWCCHMAAMRGLR